MKLFFLLCGLGFYHQPATLDLDLREDEGSFVTSSQLQLEEALKLEFRLTIDYVITERRQNNHSVIEDTITTRKFALCFVHYFTSIDIPVHYCNLRL